MRALSVVCSTFLLSTIIFSGISSAMDPSIESSTTGSSSLKRAYSVSADLDSFAGISASGVSSQPEDIEARINFLEQENRNHFTTIRTLQSVTARIEESVDHASKLSALHKIMSELSQKVDVSSSLIGCFNSKVACLAEKMEALFLLHEAKRKNFTTSCQEIEVNCAVRKGTTESMFAQRKKEMEDTYTREVAKLETQITNCKSTLCTLNGEKEKTIKETNDLEDLKAVKQGEIDKHRRMLDSIGAQIEENTQTITTSKARLVQLADLFRQDQDAHFNQLIAALERIEQEKNAALKEVTERLHTEEDTLQILQQALAQISSLKERIVSVVSSSAV